MAVYCFLSEFANNFFYKKWTIGGLYNNNPISIHMITPSRYPLQAPSSPSKPDPDTES